MCVFCHAKRVDSVCFHPKGVMKRRDQIQAELDSRVEALAYKKADADLVSVGPLI